MKIGMNMLLWSVEMGDEHVPTFEWLAEIGFDGVEIMVGDGEPEHFRALGQTLDGLKLRRSAVGALDDEHDPVSADPAVREAARGELIKMIDRAHAMGADALVGPYHSAYKTFHDRPATDDERKRSAEVLASVADHAADAGVLMAVEPLNRFECYLMNTMADARRVVDLVAHPNVGILYDTHHMHVEEKDVRAAVKTGGAAIKHVHVSENDRGRPGSGQVAWDATFAALREIGYDGWFTIEAFSRADPDFANMIHVWRDYDPAKEIAEGGLHFIRHHLAQAE